MTASQELGRRLYAEFTECFLLKESMRQQGPENELFRKELRRLSDGTFNIEDWNRWEERSFDRLTPDQQRRFQTEGLKLTGRKADAVSFNEDGLKRCMTPILVVKSVNNNAEAKKTGDSEAGLPLTVPVAKGAAVVLTDNIWPEMGLMNGSKGTVTHIVFQEGTKPENSLPAFIIVAFPVNVSDVIHGCSSADTNLSLFFSTLDNHAMSHHIDPSKIPTVVNIVLAQHQAECFSAGEVMLSDVTHQEFLKH